MRRRGKNGKTKMTTEHMAIGRINKGRAHRYEDCGGGREIRDLIPEFDFWSYNVNTDQIREIFTSRPPIVGTTKTKPFRCQQDFR